MTASSSFGRGIGFGGISPARSLSRIRSHPGRSDVKEETFVNPAILRPPDASCALWQGVQVFVKTGCTVFSKVWPKSAPVAASHSRQRGNCILV